MTPGVTQIKAAIRTSPCHYYGGWVMLNNGRVYNINGERLRQWRHYKMQAKATQERCERGHRMKSWPTLVVIVSAQSMMLLMRLMVTPGHRGKVELYR